jgi:hypothetical protein
VVGRLGGDDRAAQVAERGLGVVGGQVAQAEMALGPVHQLRVLGQLQRPFEGIDRGARRGRQATQLDLAEQHQRLGALVVAQLLGEQGVQCRPAIVPPVEHPQPERLLQPSAYGQVPGQDRQARGGLGQPHRPGVVADGVVRSQPDAQGGCQGVDVSPAVVQRLGRPLQHTHRLGHRAHPPRGLGRVDSRPQGRLPVAGLVAVPREPFQVGEGARSAGGDRLGDGAMDLLVVDGSLSFSCPARTCATVTWWKA